MSLKIYNLRISMFLNFFSGEIAKIYKKNSKAHLSTFDSKHLPLLYSTVHCTDPGKSEHNFGIFEN